MRGQPCRGTQAEAAEPHREVLGTHVEVGLRAWQGSPQAGAAPHWGSRAVEAAPVHPAGKAHREVAEAESRMQALKEGLEAGSEGSQPLKGASMP
jgi:hypothetical protein